MISSQELARAQRDYDEQVVNSCSLHAFSDEEPITHDWEGKNLYKGDEVVRFYVGDDEILVLDDRREITNFITEFFNPEPETIGEEY